MKTKTQMKDYQLRGNPVIQAVPIVGNLIYDKLGQEVLALHNERFRGIKSIEDTNNYKEGQPLAFSNVPRILSYAQILRERFPNIHVLSPEEVIQYWNAIPERDSTYADTNSIVIFPKEGPNEDLRQRVLGITGKKSKLPLVVSGLGVERADNNDGFTFIETPYIETKEAPYLKKDGNVSFNGNELVSSEEGVGVWTPSSQSGLGGFYRDRSVRLYALLDNLLYSNESGRVQVVQDPQGRAENLEALVKLLENQRDTQIAEINERAKKAEEYLRTGNFKQ